MARRKTHEEFVAELCTVNPNVEIIGAYVRSNEKVLMRCKICGLEFRMRPNNLLSGQGCPACGHAVGIQKNTKTHQQYIAELSIANPSIVVLGVYEHNQKKLRIQCSECGYIWEARPQSLLKGHGCPKCSRRYRRTQEEFVDDLAAVNSDIEVIGAFKNARTKVRLRCRICHEEWEAAPRDLLSGKGCPHCYKTSTSFMEQFLLSAFRQVLGNDEVKSRSRKAIGKELDIFIPALRFAVEPGSWDWHKDKLEFDLAKRELCRAADIRLITVYDRYKSGEPPFADDCYVYASDLGAEPGHKLLRGLAKSLLIEAGVAPESQTIDWDTVSREAYRKSRRMENDEFTRRLNEVNQNVSVISYYKGMHHTVLVRCNKCGREWSGRPSDLLRGIGCARCSGVLKPTQEEFEEKLRVVSPDIVVQGKYVNNKTRIEVRCRSCGHVWNPTPNELLVGHRCPACHPQSKRKSQEEFCEGVATVNPNLEVIGSYEGMAKHVAVRCRICGKEWNPIASSVYHAVAKRHVHDGI